MHALRVLWVAAALVMAPFAGRAQDMVEHAGASSAATSGTATKAVGKGAASALEKAIKTLDRGAAASPASGTVTTVTTVLPAPSQKPEPAPKLAAPDPALITAGMDRQELIRRFGQAAMKTTGSEDSDTAETWWYGSGDDTVTVKLLDGKVRSVSPPARGKPSASKSDSSVTVLP